MLANVSTLLHGGVSSLRIIGFKPRLRGKFLHRFFFPGALDLLQRFLRVHLRMWRSKVASFSLRS